MNISKLKEIREKINAIEGENGLFIVYSGTIRNILDAILEEEETKKNIISTCWQFNSGVKELPCCSACPACVCHL